MKIEKQLSVTKHASWDGMKMVFTDTDPAYLNNSTDAVELHLSPDEQINLAEFFDNVSAEMARITFKRMFGG